ncbi:MAG: penicillin-binding protein 1C, partial [Betaproteobacteria bacterium]|nr:penicillin-binding protein 1C [Betaproteobacteria bacterium]
AIWLNKHPEDERLGAKHAPTIKTAAVLPFRAPHLTSQLLKERGTTEKGEIFSSLDPKMQATIERTIAQRIERERGTGIRNAAAILLDSETMQVKALIGSANFFDKDIDGQVNGVLAKRSPGSTLKPFIYALAFDQGVLHPMTVLKDAPTAFGPFSPENFDGRFVGPITAQDALTRSRNVPAVQVAAKLTRPSLYDLMKTSGVANLASEKHYGLALTLGGGEVTMEELARMYAMLANGGDLRPIQYAVAKQPSPFPLPQPLSRKRERVAERPGEGTRPSTHLLSEESAFVTLDMLKTNPRPDTGQPAQPAVAWKTGTSWGFRDAWTAGVFGRYVLVVWVGNFDGAGNPAFIGVSAAAPLFFNIVDALRHEGVIANETPRLPPGKLTRVDVCAGSGDLPNADCPQRVSTWYQPGKSPIRISQLHKRVLIDRRTGEAVCDENANTQWQVIEQWPSDMQRLFREAGMPRREAPRLPDCEGRKVERRGVEPQIVSPLRAVTYTGRLSKPVPLSLRAEGVRGKQYWFSNEAFIGEVTAGESLAWNPPKAGRYVLRVVDESGLADSRDLSVEIVP